MTGQAKQCLKELMQDSVSTLGNKDGFWINNVCSYLKKREKRILGPKHVEERN